MHEVGCSLENITAASHALNLQLEDAVAEVTGRIEKYWWQSRDGIKLRLRNSGLRSRGTAPCKLSNSPAPRLKIVQLNRAKLVRLQRNRTAPGRRRLRNPVVDQQLAIHPEAHSDDL